MLLSIGNRHYFWIPSDTNNSKRLIYVIVFTYSAFMTAATARQEEGKTKKHKHMTILMALWIKISIGFVAAVFIFLFLGMIAEQKHMGDELLRYQKLKEELAEIRKQLESKSTPPALRTQLMRRMDEVWKEMVRIHASMPRHSDPQQGNYKLKR